MNVIESEAMEKPPASVEIPIRQDVLFTAIGGDGEPGGIGGDGQHGMDGTDGAIATRTSDATVRLSTPICFAKIIWPGESRSTLTRLTIQ